MELALGRSGRSSSSYDRDVPGPGRPFSVAEGDALRAPFIVSFVAFGSGTSQGQNRRDGDFVTATHRAEKTRFPNSTTTVYWYSDLIHEEIKKGN